jgi:hypothetical protein
MHEHDSNPKELKQSLCRDGVWHQDSFTFIAMAMHVCRPALCLYHEIHYNKNGHLHMRDYENLVDMACKYADDMSYPWMKTKLKHIVWVDFTEFYNTLARLVCEGKNSLPFDKIDSSLMTDLATIWVKVGTFSDDCYAASTVINDETIKRSITVE